MFFAFWMHGTVGSSLSLGALAVDLRFRHMPWPGGMVLVAVALSGCLFHASLMGFPAHIDYCQPNHSPP